MKTCSRCQSAKPLSDFHLNKRSPDGHFTICKQCKVAEAKRRYDSMTPEQYQRNLQQHRERYAKGRDGISTKRKSSYDKVKQQLADIKTNQGCLRCGEVDPSALDFHHVADKVAEIGNGNKISMAVMRAELNKCVVLCANCHRKLHAGRWQLTDRIEFIKAQYPEAYELLSTLSTDLST